MNYLIKFGRSKSNYFGTGKRSQIIWGWQGTNPLGLGMADPLEILFSATCCTVPNLIVLGQTTIA